MARHGPGGKRIAVQGGWDRIRLLQEERRDFVVAMTPREMAPALQPLDRAPLAIGIIALQALVLVVTVLLVPLLLTF